MSAITVESFHKCCRWCLSQTGERNSIFGSFLGTMLSTITGLQVAPDDGYPQQACRNCVLKLTAAFNFRQMVLENNQRLTAFMKKAISQSVSITNNVLSEVDSDHESYAMGSINMRDVEILDDEHDDQMPHLGLLQGSTHLGTSEGENSVEVDTMNSEPDELVLYEDSIPDSNDNNDLFLKCRHCPRKFANLKERTKHTLTHMEPCKHCKKLVSRRNYQRHVLTHSEFRPYACRVCDRRFHDPTNRMAHERRHCKASKSIDNYHLCNHCGKKYKLRTSLNKHLRIHTRKDILVCDVCSKEFTHRSYFEEHKETHNQTRLYSCPKCETNAKKYSSEKSLKNHMRRIHSPSRQRYQCELCDCSFYYKSSMQRHTEAHKKTSVICQICDTLYASVNNQHNVLELMRDEA